MNLARIGWSMVVIGVAALLAAPFVILRIIEAENLKAEARRSGPPPAIAIEAFDPNRHVGLGAETTVLGQLDPTEILAEPAPDVRWIAPLWATEADDAAPEPRAWIAHGATAISDDLFRALRREDGPQAPIVEINGRLIDPRRLAAAFDLLGASWSADTVVIEPFLDGRATAIAEAPRWRMRAALWVIGPLALILAGWVWARTARRPHRRH